MISLEKKSPINLTKKVPGLNNIRIGLSWDEHLINGKSADADSSVFMLGENGKIPNDGYFVFYNNLISADGAVKHHGDNRTGAGDGDDESVDINLSKVSTEIQQILMAISIHNSDEGFNFGNTKNASVRLYNMDTNEGICEFQLTEEFPDSDSIIMGRLYRDAAEWKFEVMVTVFNGGLQACLNSYA
jgi:tellurium resistance protein TerD